MQQITEAHKIDISTCMLDKIAFSSEINRLKNVGILIESEQSEKDEWMLQIQELLNPPSDEPINYNELLDEINDKVTAYHQQVKHDSEYMLDELSTVIKMLYFEIQNKDEIIMKKQQLLESCSIECDLCQIFNNDEDVTKKNQQNILNRVRMRLDVIHNLLQPSSKKFLYQKSGKEPEDLRAKFVTIKNQCRELARNINNSSLNLDTLASQLSCQNEDTNSLLNLQHKIEAIKHKSLIDQRIKIGLTTIDQEQNTVIEECNKLKTQIEQDIAQFNTFMQQIKEFKQHLFNNIMPSQSNTVDTSKILQTINQLNFCLNYLQEKLNICSIDASKEDCFLSHIFLLKWATFQHQDAVERLMNCQSELSRYQNIEIDLMEILQRYKSLVPKSITHVNENDIIVKKSQVQELYDKSIKEIKNLRKRIDSYNQVVTNIENFIERDLVTSDVVVVPLPDLVQSIHELPDNQMFQMVSMYLLDQNHVLKELDSLQNALHQKQTQPISITTTITSHNDDSSPTQKTDQEIDDEIFGMKDDEQNKTNSQNFQEYENSLITQISNIITDESNMSWRHFELIKKKIQLNNVREAISSLNKLKLKIKHDEKLIKLLDKLEYSLKHRPSHQFDKYFTIIQQTLNQFPHDKNAYKRFTAVSNVTLPFDCQDKVNEYIELLDKLKNTLLDRLLKYKEQHTEDLEEDYVQEMIIDIEDAAASVELLIEHIANNVDTFCVQQKVDETKPETTEQPNKELVSKEECKEKIKKIIKKTQTLQTDLQKIMKDANKKQYKECKRFEDLMVSIRDFFQNSCKVDEMDIDEITKDITTAQQEITNTSFFIKRF